MGLNVDLVSLIGLPERTLCPKCEEDIATNFDDYDLDCGDPNPKRAWLKLDIECSNCCHKWTRTYRVLSQFLEQDSDLTFPSENEPELSDEQAEKLVTITSDDKVMKASFVVKPTAIASPERKRLYETRKSLTHHFEIMSQEIPVDGYVTVGFYPDGRVGEVFVRLSKVGSTIGSLADQWAIAVSMLLQTGTPLGVICEKFAFTRFEPAGMTKNPDIPIAHSVIDYVARWLSDKFVRKDESEEDGGTETEDGLSKVRSASVRRANVEV